MFKKDLLTGGISSILISILSILKSIFLIRLFELSNLLDSFFLGISIFQILSLNIVRYFILGMQPNILGENSLYKGTYFYLSISFSLILNISIFLFSKNILGLFTENIELQNTTLGNFNVFLILSIASTFYLIINSYLNTIISIRLSLLFDVLIGLLLFISVFISEGDLYQLITYHIISYIILITTEVIIILNKDNIKPKLILNRLWLKNIFNNFKNYMFSFGISITSSIFEKRILTSGLSNGDLTIYNTISKGISPFTSILSNQSVLLVSYAKKQINQSKSLLIYHSKNITLIAITLIITVNFILLFTKDIITRILDISTTDADLIVVNFKTLSISIFSSVVFSSISKFLAAFNLTQYIVRINTIVGIQLIILLYCFRNLGITGVTYAITINSFFALFYALYFLRKVISFSIYRFIKKNKIHTLIIFLFLFYPFQDFIINSILIKYLISIITVLLSLTLIPKNFKTKYE